MREESGKFEEMTEEESMELMEKIKYMGEEKFNEFLKGMKADEMIRYQDGYFEMSEEEREQYDLEYDERREGFEKQDFLDMGWGQEYDKGEGGEQGGWGDILSIFGLDGSGGLFKEEWEKEEDSEWGECVKHEDCDRAMSKMCCATVEGKGQGQFCIYEEKVADFVFTCIENATHLAASAAALAATAYLLI